MEMDLQEKTRMLDVYKDIESIIEKITELPVGQPLVWVWVWDIARQIHHDIQGGGEPDYCLTMDEEEMWELFWTQADKNGFSLEYGTEDLYESIRDWMIDQSIIEEYEEEDLDEDLGDVVESDTEEE
jgi:hypothetical protein